MQQISKYTDTLYINTNEQKRTISKKQFIWVQYSRIRYSSKAASTALPTTTRCGMTYPKPSNTVINPERSVVGGGSTKRALDRCANSRIKGSQATFMAWVARSSSSSWTVNRWATSIMNRGHIAKWRYSVGVTSPPTSGRVLQSLLMASCNAGSSSEILGGGGNCVGAGGGD